jgi:hypothetical protein
LDVTVVATCSTKSCNLKVRLYWMTTPRRLFDSQDYDGNTSVYTFCIPTPISNNFCVVIEKGEPSCDLNLTSTYWCSNYYPLPYTGPDNPTPTISFCLGN